jgi:hypothetical protein
MRYRHNPDISDSAWTCILLGKIPRSCATRESELPLTFFSEAANPTSSRRSNEALLGLDHLVPTPNFHCSPKTTTSNSSSLEILHHLESFLISSSPSPPPLPVSTVTPSILVSAAELDWTCLDGRVRDDSSWVENLTWLCRRHSEGVEGESSRRRASRLGGERPSKLLMRGSRPPQLVNRTAQSGDQLPFAWI